MALDEHLAGLAAAGRIGFAFRLYGWSPACVSFGRLQDPSREADLHSIVASGVDIVRRPTGGRAVWHENEITYSVIASGMHPLARKSISESLEMTGEALVRPLRKMGVPASLSPRGSRDPHARTTGNPCFTSHGASEITVGGRKLVGSAQARIRDAFLEHGSILLHNDQPGLLSFLRMPPDEMEALSAKLAEGTCCLADISPSLDVDALRQAMLESFSDLAGGDLEQVSAADVSEDGLAELTLRKREESEAWLAIGR